MEYVILSPLIIVESAHLFIVILLEPLLFGKLIDLIPLHKQRYHKRRWASWAGDTSKIIQSVRSVECSQRLLKLEFRETDSFLQWALRTDNQKTQYYNVISEKCTQIEQKRKTSCRQSVSAYISSSSKILKQFILNFVYVSTLEYMGLIFFPSVQSQHERKNPVVRPRLRLEDNIKIDLRT